MSLERISCYDDDGWGVIEYTEPVHGRQRLAVWGADTLDWLAEECRRVAAIIREEDAELGRRAFSS